MSLPESPEPYEEVFLKENLSEHKEENSYEEEFDDHFLDLLAKEPEAQDIVREIKTRFHEMELVTKRSFDESLDASRPYERIKIVDLFAQRSALDYISLHKNLMDMLELASHLTDEEKECVMHESEKIATFYEGHTLLSFYANRRGLEKKKSITSLNKNTENAALQQFMAQYYLRHKEIVPEFESKLDNYGERAFGSKEDYVAFKTGVVSLADAYQHLEARGYGVFFPPPKMDAEQAIDLFCVDNSLPDEFREDLEAFFTSDYSAEDLSELPPEVLGHIYGTQVKTRHRLKETYAGAFDHHGSLADVVDMLELGKRTIDGVLERVLQETVFQKSSIESVTRKKTLAAIFECPAMNERPFSFTGAEHEDMQDLSLQQRRVLDDIQEVSTFIGQIRGIGSAYVFVEQIDEEETRRNFY